MFARAPLQKLALLFDSADYFFKVLFPPLSRWICILTNFLSVCQHRFFCRFPMFSVTRNAPLTRRGIRMLPDATAFVNSVFGWFFPALSPRLYRLFSAALSCERSNILSNTLSLVNAFVPRFKKYFAPAIKPARLLQSGCIRATRAVWPTCIF